MDATGTDAVGTGAVGTDATATGEKAATAPAVTVTALAVAASAVAASAVVAAATATRYPVAPGHRVNVRSGPGTQYPVVRALPLDATVAISCQKYGERITGPYGTTRLWDRIAPGEYVSDSYVRTGSDGMVAPACS